MYTLEQIIQAWKESYDEDLMENYQGFIDVLTKGES
jgi:hypothetical protein